MTSRPLVVAVVPAYNEEASVAAVVRDLSALDCRPVVVVVDDASTDGTAAAARAAGAVVLRPPFNLGIGGAVQTGFRWAVRAGADAAVQVDGDGQHPAGEVPRLLAAVLDEEADVAIGSRFLGRGAGDRSTGLRRAGITWLSLLVQVRSGRRFTDPTSGLRAVGRQALEWLAEHYPEDYPEPQVLAPLVRAGFRVEEFPVAMRAREGGQSSIRGLAPVLYMIKVSLAVCLGSMK